MNQPAERFRLIGLLLGATEMEWTAYLSRSGSDKVYTPTVVRDGDFLFEDLEKGTYTLILDSPEGRSEREIHLQNIQV